MKDSTLFRTCFGIVKGWRYRHLLKIALAHSGPFGAIALNNIKIIVFDIDGVLTPHGVAAIAEPQMTALKKLTAKYQTFFLTNNPFPARRAWLNENFPEVELITGFPKKPSPLGLLEIQKRTQVQAKEILLIDDRLLTGGLTAAIAKTQFYLVKPALRDFRQHTLKEIMFAMFRLLEQWYVRLIGRCFD